MSGRSMCPGYLKPSQSHGSSDRGLTKMTNFDLDDAVTRYQRVLEKSGISNELERQKIRRGDTVTIAGYELTWGEQDEELVELEELKMSKILQRNWRER